MTSSRSLRRRSAWAVPAVTVAAVGAIALVPSAASAGPHPMLPRLSPAQLLAAVESSATTALSGEIVETARLGLPSLPGTDSGSALSWQTLVTGTHTAQLWVNGTDRQRLALLGQLSESDVVRNGKDVWTYSSDTGKATHRTLSAKDHRAAGGETPAKPDVASLGSGGLTPLDAAKKALAEIDPSTAVGVDPTARVAGQKAYTLVLRPRRGGSTIHKILIAVDSVHHVPLRVQIFNGGRQAAFETAFQNIVFATPDASVFQFTPPQGSTVTTPPAPSGLGAAGDTTAPTSAESGPKVVGSGWSSVLVFPASASGASPLAALSGAGGTSGVTGRQQRKATLSLERLMKQRGKNKLLSTGLINLLVTSDGRVLVGAVTPGVLEQAAAGPLR